MYLLLYKDASDKEIIWLMRNALPVSPAAWIHNAEVPGTIAVIATNTVLKNLRDEIDESSYRSLNTIESKIKDNSLRGITKRLAINKLRVICEASQEMEIIGFAKDLLAILGEGENDLVGYNPKKEEKEMPLGLDKKVIEDYFLRLAKDPSIH
jgi:hypothetical protein